eukprot:5142243-Pleurochrysis_carterae.AAC.6
MATSAAWTAAAFGACVSSPPTWATSERRRKRTPFIEVEAVVGKVVAEGQTAYANQGKAAAAVVRRRPLPHRLERLPTRHVVVIQAS